jgi:branched-subunit amino acid ABC-type transport system permease component
MKLELPTDDIAFLRTQLMRRLRDLEYERAHTDNRRMQQALGVDVERVRRLNRALARALTEIDVVV